MVWRLYYVTYPPKSFNMFSGLYVTKNWHFVAVSVLVLSTMCDTNNNVTSLKHVRKLSIKLSMNEISTLKIHRQRDIVCTSCLDVIMQRQHNLVWLCNKTFKFSQILTKNKRQATMSVQRYHLNNINKQGDNYIYTFHFYDTLISVVTELDNASLQTTQRSGASVGEQNQTQPERA